MNTSAMIVKSEWAKNQLIVAALAQFGKYGLYATTHDIAVQAGQNIAAITYYFGSEEDLHLAYAQWVVDFIGAQFHPHAEEAERLFVQPEPDRDAMRELILHACRGMIMLLTQSDIVNLNKLISHEQLSPIAVYQLVRDQVTNPLHTRLTCLIAVYMGSDVNDTQMTLHTHAILGEVLTLCLGKETILLRAGRSQFGEDKTALIDQMTTCHIDPIL